MERKTFEPIDGVTPRWKKLYDLVMGRKVGDEITYREALEVLGLPRTDRGLHIAQQTMRTTMEHLERDGHSLLGNVAKFGWVVLDPQRELQQTDRRVTKTRRAAGRAVRGVGSLNNRRDELSQFERERLDWISRSANLAMTASSRRGRKTTEELLKMIEGSAG